MKRKVCAITGSRADYGLLKPLLEKIKNDDSLDLQLVVTGTHLSPIHGHTVNEISSDGFVVDYEIESVTEKDGPIEIANAMSKVMAGSARAFAILKPDLILILGDRFEMFAAAGAAVVARLPIAHIHGGEVTIGAYDDSFRHAITKLSSIHFVATEEARRRVIQLGESPGSVRLVGGLGVDAIQSLRLLSMEAIQTSLKLVFKSKRLIVTFHPTTLDGEDPEQQTRELLAALGEQKDTTIILTSSNADSGGHTMNSLIQTFVNNNENAFFFPSLGQFLYLSCLSISDGVIGNSSSGLLEAPSFGIGTVNIGIRQLGRPKATSVIDCGPSRSEISRAITTLYSDQFKESLQHSLNPYGSGGASEKILKSLKEFDLSEITMKKFFDLQADNLKGKDE